MEKIKKLLAEYEIRFHDTDEILESSAINPEWMVNKGAYIPDIYEHKIHNKNGAVYLKDHDGERWATAKLTKKPEKWVVEKDENHPVWEKFIDTYPHKYDNEQVFFSSNYFWGATTFSSNYFWGATTMGGDELYKFSGFQYLTLDQWAEFFLPKVDFSIHNETDWFFVMLKNKRKFLIKGKLDNDYLIFPLIPNEMYPEGHFINKDDIIEFRRPTDEEMNVLYWHHPEYAPPKEGDWGVFWDRKESTIYISSLRSIINEKKLYADAYGSCWHHFTPFSPELQEMLKKEIDNI